MKAARSGARRGLRFATRAASSSRLAYSPAAGRCAQLVEPRGDPLRRLRGLRARQSEALEVHEPGDAGRPHARVNHGDVRAHAVADDARAPARAEDIDHLLEVGVVVREPVAAGTARAAAEAAPVDGEERQCRIRLVGDELEGRGRVRETVQEEHRVVRIGPPAHDVVRKAADGDGFMTARADRPVSHRLRPAPGAGPAACRCAGRPCPRPRNAARASGSSRPSRAGARAAPARSRRASCSRRRSACCRP